MYYFRYCVTVSGNCCNNNILFIINCNWNYGSKMRRTAKKFLFLRTGIFLSNPTGLAYHHASACISSTRHSRVVSHHTFRCEYCRLDDMQLLTKLMICNSYGIDDMQGYALIVALRANGLTFVRL